MISYTQIRVATNANRGECCGSGPDWRPEEGETMSKEKMFACAKGSWQREIVADLIRYGVITNPIKGLRGTAKEYKQRYEESFRNLISRLESEAGVKVRVVQYGPRGGMWSAKYGIV
jgi:hypothetical protein